MITSRDYGHYALLGTSVLADVLSVLSFLGWSASPNMKLVVGISLLILAAVTAICGLWTSFGLWLSPRGSHYPASQHATRIGGAIFATVLAAVLGVFVIRLVSAEGTHDGTPGVPLTPTVTSTPTSR
jgi:hypothetical protein